MSFERKAEYEFRAVLAWHVVPTGGGRSLCGRLLAPAAPTRAAADVTGLANACLARQALLMRTRRPRVVAPTLRTAA